MKYYVKYNVVGFLACNIVIYYPSHAIFDLITGTQRPGPTGAPTQVKRQGLVLNFSILLILYLCTL